MAFQLSLDLYESATQQFLLKVKSLLKALVSAQQPMELGDEASVKSEDTTSSSNVTETSVIAEDKIKVNDSMKNVVDKLLYILSGEITISANMQFLIKNNHSDLLILKTIKVIICIFFY